jgi:hypothetical protein
MELKSVRARDCVNATSSNLGGYPAFDHCQPTLRGTRMADHSKQQQFAVPTRDKPNAPIIFFERAPLSGYADGIVSITLSTFCPETQPSGEVRREAVIAAHLKCSIQAAVNLREALNNALSRASAIPEVTQQLPKGRKN